MERRLLRPAAESRTILTQALHGPLRAHEQPPQVGMRFGRTRLSGNDGAEFPLGLLVIAGFYEQPSQVAPDHVVSGLALTALRNSSDALLICPPSISLRPSALRRRDSAAAELVAEASPGPGELPRDPSFCAMAAMIDAGRTMTIVTRSAHSSCWALNRDGNGIAEMLSLAQFDNQGRVVARVPR